MALLKAFKAYRPGKELAVKIASRPYDVLSPEEARKEAEGNPYSFLHVIKPEIDLPEDIDPHSPVVYQKGKENLYAMIEKGWYKQDEENFLYVYAQRMNDHTQYGLAGCAGVSDYMNNIIRKHELTRPDKEKDRMNHIRVSNFNQEPVFFTYPDHEGIDEIVGEVIKEKPEYDFVADDGIGHQFWVIGDPAKILRLEDYFARDITFTYVADGHHRTAAAALVGHERASHNPGHTGMEEYNFFMAVHFPVSQLNIIDYNRVVKDLNGHSKNDFIHLLERNFKVVRKGEEPYKPRRPHNFSMYLGGSWYSLTALEGRYDDNDPIGCLDVTVLSEQVLGPLLNISDLRKSRRIGFVGGTRGLGELARRVDSGEMKVAFALYPVSMEQLTRIADTGNIMPPKTTWFEPKLRSGLFLHELD